VKQQKLEKKICALKLMTDSLHDHKVKKELQEKQETRFKKQFWEERNREERKIALIKQEEEISKQ